MIIWLQTLFIIIFNIDSGRLDFLKSTLNFFKSAMSKCYRFNQNYLAYPNNKQINKNL